MARIRFQVGTRHFAIDWYPTLYKRGDRYFEGLLQGNVYDASHKDYLKPIGHVEGWSIEELKLRAKELVEKDLRKMGLYGIAEDKMIIPQQPKDFWR